MDALMEQLDTLKQALARVEKDTERLRSDTNDIKENQRELQIRVEQMASDLEKLYKAIFGNGDSMEHRLTELEGYAKVQEEFRQEMRSLMNKWGSGIIIAIAVAVLLSWLGL